MPGGVAVPLRFAPLFKPALWGGQQLRPMLGAKPSQEPTGEAWLLSDVLGSENGVSEGPAAGLSLTKLVKTYGERLMGCSLLTNGRFPILLKFIEAQQALSVQVHPNDAQARRLEPTGPGLGKTEAWTILRTEADGLLYAGLREGQTRTSFEKALNEGKISETLYSAHPKVGDCVSIEAGTVHAIGAGLILFEIQQTSDITYRLDDWGRVDPKTGKPRELHIAKGLECIDFGRGPCLPVVPKVISAANPCRELLIDCPHFQLSRLTATEHFSVGIAGECTVLVAIEGAGILHGGGESFPLRFGDTFVLPAELTGAAIDPTSGPITILECRLPRQQG